MPCKLTDYGRYCIQNNQLPTKIHVELEDGFIIIILPLLHKRCLVLHKKSWVAGGMCIHVTIGCGSVNVGRGKWRSVEYKRVKGVPYQLFSFSHTSSTTLEVEVGSAINLSSKDRPSYGTLGFGTLRIISGLSKHIHMPAHIYNLFPCSHTLIN